MNISNELNRVIEMKSPAEFKRVFFPESRTFFFLFFTCLILYFPLSSFYVFQVSPHSVNTTQFFTIATTSSSQQLCQE